MKLNLPPNGEAQIVDEMPRQNQFLRFFVLGLVLVQPAYSKKKANLVPNKSELPKGLWSGISEHNTRITVSFCEDNTYLEREGKKKTKIPITFRMDRDEKGLTISLISPKTGKWLGETLIYQKQKAKLFLLADNGESELTTDDMLPMRQVTNDCETCFVAPALHDRGLQADNGAQQNLPAALAAVQ